MLPPVWSFTLHSTWSWGLRSMKAGEAWVDVAKRWGGRCCEAPTAYLCVLIDRLVKQWPLSGESLPRDGCRCDWETPKHVGMRLRLTDRNVWCCTDISHSALEQIELCNLFVHNQLVTFFWDVCTAGHSNLLNVLNVQCSCVGWTRQAFIINTNDWKI